MGCWGAHLEVIPKSESFNLWVTSFGIMVNWLGCAKIWRAIYLFDEEYENLETYERDSKLYQHIKQGPNPFWLR